MNTKARTRRRAKAQSAAPDFEVIVIGAGMGGIAAGIKLQGIGVTDFLIVDRDEAFGGTWLRNTYPGVAANLPMVAYQFSFAPKADWKRFFARQAPSADLSAPSTQELDR